MNFARSSQSQIPPAIEQMVPYRRSVFFIRQGEDRHEGSRKSSASATVDMDSPWNLRLTSTLVN